MSPGAMASSDGARELGGPEVDDHFELGRLPDRKVLRLCALQDLVHIGCRAAIIFNRVGATACANAFYCPPPCRSGATMSGFLFTCFTAVAPNGVAHARHEIRCCRGLRSTDARSR